MAKTRSSEPKIETGRKTIRKPRKPQKKISIPMILSCDGDVSKLLPLFIKIVDLITKKNVRRKVNGGRRKKVTIGKTTSRLPDYPEPGMESSTALSSEGMFQPAAPKKSSVRRGQTRKAANTKARQALPGPSRRRRQQGPKRPSFGPRARRKSLIPSKFFKPKPSSPMGSEMREDLTLPSPSARDVQFPFQSSFPSPSPSQAYGQVASLNGPIAPLNESLLGFETRTDTSNSSMQNETADKFDARLMFMAAQRAALEALSTVGDGLRPANEISYNFQEAWNEAVARQQSEYNMIFRPLGISTLTMTHLCLAAPERASTASNTNPVDQPNVATTPGNSSIFNHIRNSLDDICSTISSPQHIPSTSDLSETPGDVSVDIYNHIRASLRDDMSQADRDNLK